MCSDSNTLFRDVYRCRAIAAYAHACALKNVIIDWMDPVDDNNDREKRGDRENRGDNEKRGNKDHKELRLSCHNSNYGKCTGGAVYTERAPTKNKTCRELSMKSHEKFANIYGFGDEAIPGCICPDGQLYEDLGFGTLQCVPKSSCSCYDVSSNHFYAAGEQIKRACSTW